MPFELHTTLQEIDRLDARLDELEQLLADFIVTRPSLLAQLDHLLLLDLELIKRQRNQLINSRRKIATHERKTSLLPTEIK